MLLIDSAEGRASSGGSRITRDIYIAVNTNSWKQYDSTMKILKEQGFIEKSRTPEHRLFGDKYPVDIIPWGSEIVENNRVEWPDSKRKMNASGLQYIFRSYKLQKIRENLTLPILTLPVSVYLKILTYSDRNEKKDLEDAIYILIHYEEIEISERRFELPDNIIADYDLCGACLTGMDLKSVISKKNIAAMKIILMEKIKPDTLTIDYLADKFFETPEFIQRLLSSFIEGLK